MCITEDVTMWTIALTDGCNALAVNSQKQEILLDVDLGRQCYFVDEHGRRRYFRRDGRTLMEIDGQPPISWPSPKYIEGEHWSGITLH
jgi:hypothetical protein